MKQEKLTTMAQKLEDYFKNTPKEQIQAEWDRIIKEREQRQKEAEDNYNGNFRDMCWLMTSWVDETGERSAGDPHIFATMLVRLIEDRGFEIVKKKQ